LLLEIEAIGVLWSVGQYMICVAILIRASSGQQAGTPMGDEDKHVCSTSNHLVLADIWYRKASGQAHGSHADPPVKDNDLVGVFETGAGNLQSVW